MLNPIMCVLYHKYMTMMFSTQLVLHTLNVTPYIIPSVAQFSAQTVNIFNALFMPIHKWLFIQMKHVTHKMIDHKEEKILNVLLYKK